MRASGHVTGYFAGGSREGLERARQTQCFSQIIHLAKLNPKCHVNYSIIFTEINFSPETSILDDIWVGYSYSNPICIIQYSGSFLFGCQTVKVTGHGGVQVS